MQTRERREKKNTKQTNKTKTLLRLHMKVHGNQIIISILVFSPMSGKEVELNHPFPKGDFKHFRLIRNSLPRSFTWP